MDLGSHLVSFVLQSSIGSSSGLDTDSLIILLLGHVTVSGMMPSDRALLDYFRVLFMGNIRVVKNFNRLPRGARNLIPENIQCQVGWGSEQPDLIKDTPVHCRGG